MAISSTNVRNSSWNLANILLYPVAFLAVTPFFINRMGENVFGEWMLVNSYVYIAVHLVGFGLPASITAHVAEAIGKGDDRKLFAYINASSRLLLRMVLLTVAFGFFLLTAWLLGIGIFDDRIWKALIVATFLIAIRFPELLYQGIFKGQEHYHKAAIFNMLNRFITLGAQVVMVWKGYSLPAIFGAALVTSFLSLIPQAFIIYRGLRGYSPILFRSLPEKHELYHFGFWTWIQTIIAIAAYQLDRFLVAFFLGTATVTYYVLASTIANHLHMAFEAMVSWLLPRVSRMQAATRDTRPYFSTTRAFSIGFPLLVLSTLYFVSEPLFTLWLGEDKYLKMVDFFRLFLVFEAFLILSVVPKYYLNAIRSLHFITLLELMYKSAIIVGMIACFYFYRSAGSLIWGQIIALIIFMPVEYMLINNRILKENWFKETILTSLPSVCIMGIILLPDRDASFIAFLLAALIFWMVYLKDRYFDIKLIRE